MKLSQAKLYLPIIQAIVEGKTVQLKGVGYREWADIDNTHGNLFHSNDIDAGFEYRIKPEKKLRAWRPQEVLIGIWFRSGDNKYALTCVQGHGVFMGSGAGHTEATAVHTFESLLRDFEYTNDGGKTWLPCGIEE